MRLFKLKTPWLALIFSVVAVSLHIGAAYLIRACFGRSALAGFWQHSISFYWPAFGVAGILGFLHNVGPLTAISAVIVAVLVQWWTIFATGIWLVRLCCRKSPMSKTRKIAIAVAVVAAGVCFYEIVPKTLGLHMGDPRTPLERAMSLGDTHTVEKILKSNPSLANKPFRFANETPLFYATMCRNPQVNIDLLVANGADINARSGGFNLTPLQQAAWSGKLEAVRALLAHKPDVNATTGAGDTALTYAFVADSKEIFNLLLDHGADINHGRSALAACMIYGGGRDSWPEFLLSKGADPNRRGSQADRFVPIIQAILNRNTNYVAALLRHHVHLNVQYVNGADDFSPLELAMDEGRLDIALMLQNYVLESRSNTVSFAAAHGDLVALRNLLQEHPQSIEEKDALGFTPLAWAAEAGQRDAAELLLSLGADPNASTKGGRHPIDWAAAAGHLSLVELLAAKGANDLSIALFLAIQQQQIPVARYLLEHGANPNLYYPASNSTMPLHLAARQGNLEEAELLLRHGASVNGLEQNGDTPLVGAAGGTSREVVELLFNNGATISQRPGYWTVFQHWALCAGDTNVAMALLSHGANVDAKDGDGRTALHFAAQQGTVQAVEWLLKNSANVNVKDNKGQTPLSLLKSRRRGRVVEKRKDIGDLLRKYGAKE
jgi:ankyrin repeat protein